MDEQITDVEQAGAEQTGLYDRRQVLRRGAIVVGAATLWTAPVVQSLGMRPAAAGSADETDSGGSLCPPGSGSGQPRDLIFRWNGVGGTSTALIVIQRPGSDRLCTTVGSGGLFQVTNKAGSNWRVGIYDPADAPSFSGKGTWKNLPEGGVLLDSSEFHTSCSEPPLHLGDSFGTITLVAGTASGADQRQQVLSGVSLSSVQVATTDCAVHATPDESKTEAEEPEVEEVREVEAADVEAEADDGEGLKTGDVEVEGEGVETARVETEKVEAPSAADDESDDPDAGASS